MLLILPHHQCDVDIAFYNADRQQRRAGASVHGQDVGQEGLVWKLGPLLAVLEVQRVWNFRRSVFGPVLYQFLYRN